MKKTISDFLDNLPIYKNSIMKIVAFQLLVKDHEKKFESMEMENQLHKTNAKECDKKVSSLERENNVMLQHILVLKDIVLGKSKSPIQNKKFYLYRFHRGWGHTNRK